MTAADEALIVIDVQNDFCPGGKLAVPGGNEVVPLINRLARSFKHVVLTQDWHPAEHKSFATAHPAKNPFEIAMMHYGPQTLWPDHCIQNTHGAEFHKDLSIPHAELILRKGFREVEAPSQLLQQLLQPRNHRTGQHPGWHLTAAPRHEWLR